ncbi:3-hydroxyisobutyryl-CoA hydrolase 1 [Jatropha curcas]|uniref:3-hydroxyisobutyryl-CoA hydrolase 1 n=1 Tax=Jatropha curcas TaxID=180498 RepID=UPI0018950830|nr:3-hydroxyisobutyryl-CoA hydrolase 1 [Jatropha curcas]
MASNFSFKRELNQVLFEGDSHFKKVILNRPRKLNILSYEMISQMLTKFRAFETDPTIKFVILKGNGKAFCAGGDVVSSLTAIIAGHWSYGARFYEKQFNLDYLLARYYEKQFNLDYLLARYYEKQFNLDYLLARYYEKQFNLDYLLAIFIQLIDGIVNGGGARIDCMHGRFRDCPPENASVSLIGLFPDLGASHFLSRLPGYFGEYLGLTGARVDGAEMFACGLATHFVSSKDLLNLENALEIQTSLEMTKIYKVIEKFAQNPKIKEDSPYNRLEIIDKCFSKDTVEEILLALENEVKLKNKAENWIIKAINSMKSASPTSLKITLRSIREGRQQNLKQCFIREYTICCNIVRATAGRDYFEGSRAMFFDKDKKPKWEPSKLELVSKDMIDRCFSAIDEDDWEYLKLPSRSDTMEKILQPRL